jgi:CelD/BcsL family acetyltransferase involved in cellulose biosynthesis
MNCQKPCLIWIHEILLPRLKWRNTEQVKDLAGFVRLSEFSTMRVKLVDNIQDLRKIYDRWRNLLDISEVIPIYLNPIWVYNWLKYIGRKYQPYILMVWNKDELEGIAPFALKNIGFLKKLQFIGQPGADYLDFIIKEGRKTGVTEAIFSFLERHSKEWDICDLADFYGESLAWKDLISFLNANGWLFRQFDAEECPFLRIEGDWDDFYKKQHSRKFRYNLRRSKRKLEELGKLEFKKLETQSEIEQYLPEVFKVHHMRWRGYYIGSKFSTSSGQKFYTEIAKDYLAKGWLKLTVMLLNGRVIAYSYSFFWNGRYFFYNPAFDPRYSQYSPGTLLLLFLLEDSFDSGICEFDFGKGELSYKHHWGTDSRQSKRIIFASPKLKGKIVFYLYLVYLRLRGKIRKSSKLRTFLGKLLQMRYYRT